jgi:hypothetical protein
MTKNQKIIAVHAPAIFACFTTIAVGDRAQKKLARTAEETTMTGPKHTPEPKPVSEGAPMSLPDPPNWIVTTQIRKARMPLAVPVCPQNCDGTLGWSVRVRSLSVLDSKHFQEK